MKIKLNKGKRGSSSKLCKPASTGAILDQNIPEDYKDYILEAALETIQKVAENKADCFATYEVGHKKKKPKTIYKPK